MSLAKLAVAYKSKKLYVYFQNCPTKCTSPIEKKSDPDSDGEKSLDL